MTAIDCDTNGAPDGIINIYDQYNALPSVVKPISLPDGIWCNLNFNFALNEITSDLFLWDLDNASRSITDYQFQFIFGYTAHDYNNELKAEATNTFKTMDSLLSMI